MKEWIEKWLKRAGIFTAVATAITSIAYFSGLNTACFWIFHQPKVPKSIRRKEVD